jgi:multimeric flavodoxin WrbA
MRIIAIVGSYRKGGVVDRAVDAILAAARDEGAKTTKVYLVDRHIEYCTNCRTCTQQPGPERGECVLDDDVRGLLDEIERSDAIVLGSPMNFGTVTAVTKTFIERLVCYAHWPWGGMVPKTRGAKKDKPAVVVAASAAPALLSRMTSGMVGLMKKTAGLLGAKPVGVLFVGVAAMRQQTQLSERTLRKARRLGRRLVAKSVLHSAAGPG